MLAQTDRPRGADALTGRDLKDEYVLLGRAGDRLHVLNDTAREIFLLCDGCRTVREIVGTMTERFEVTEAQAADDVRDTLSEFVALGIVTLD
jgi:hypothetical protein